MSGARKPKFRVGQVVAEIGESVYFCVEEVISDGAGDYFYDVGTLMRWDESNLRPLTAREIGPSAAGKRRGAK